MSKKVLVFIIVIMILLGAGFRLLTERFSPQYLYHRFLGGEFYVNPRAEIDTASEYIIEIWYYPFYRMISNRGEEELLDNIEKELQKEYPNINFKYKRLNFLTGEQKLKEKLGKGSPPDIYINFGIDQYISPGLQIPIEDYISSEEKENYFLGNELAGHFWGWPFLIDEVVWVNNSLDMEEGMITEEKFAYIAENNYTSNFILNFYDENLLRQLLSVYGYEGNITFEDDFLSLDFFEVMSKIINDMSLLNDKKIVNMYDVDEMLKGFFEEENTIIGPINPWLRTFIKRENDELTYLKLNNRIQLYTLNVFRQQPYQGHDHTRAVMETAKFISTNYSDEIADVLGLEAGYQKEGFTEKNAKIIPGVYPEDQELWEEKILSFWIEMWNNEFMEADDLTADSIKDIIRNEM